MNNRDTERGTEHETLFPKPSASHIYTISRVCALIGGVPVETIRHWEKSLGSLLGTVRLAGGARRYSESDVSVLREFVALKASGYTNGGARNAIAERRASRREIDSVEQALAAIDSATKQIVRASATLDEAREFLLRNTTER